MRNGERRDDTMFTLPCHSHVIVACPVFSAGIVRRVAPRAAQRRYASAHMRHEVDADIMSMPGRGQRGARYAQRACAREGSTNRYVTAAMLPCASCLARRLKYFALQQRAMYIDGVYRMPPPVFASSARAFKSWCHGAYHSQITESELLI